MAVGGNTFLAVTSGQVVSAVVRSKVVPDHFGILLHWSGVCAGFFWKLRLKCEDNARLVLV